VSERTGLMILRKKIQSIKAEASQSEINEICPVYNLSRNSAILDMARYEFAGM